MENALSSLAAQAARPEGNVTEARPIRRENNDTPVALSDVEKLLAFAESITLSE